MPTLEELAKKAGVSPIQPGSSLSDLAQRAGVQPIVSRETIPEEKTSAVGNFVRGMVKPLAKTGVNAYNLGEGITRKLAGQDTQTAFRDIEKERDVPFVGKTKPVTTMKDTIGTGLQVGAFALPGEALIAKPVSMLAKAGASSAAGAIGGAVNALGESVEGAQGWKDFLSKDTLKNVAGDAALGAVTGGALSAVGRGVQKSAQALTRDVEKKFVSAVEQGVNKAFKPSVKSVKTPVMRERYFEDAREAVRAINENKDNFSFTNSDGQVVSRNPQSLQETMDAIGITKKKIFQDYNQFVQTSGGRGAQVDLRPMAEMLRKTADDKVLNTHDPEMANRIRQMANQYERTGTFSVEEAQNALEMLNSSLKHFYSNPDYNSATKAVTDAAIANNLRKSLDDVVEQFSGPGYQQLRNRYKALKTIESDVARQAAVEARKNVKGLVDFSDILTGGQLVHGLASLNPSMIAGSLTQKAIAKYYKYLNSPARAIKNMFEAAERSPARAPIRPDVFGASMRQATENLALPQGRGANPIQLPQRMGDKGFSRVSGDFSPTQLPVESRPGQFQLPQSGSNPAIRLPGEGVLEGQRVLRGDMPANRITRPSDVLEGEVMDIPPKAPARAIKRPPSAFNSGTVRKTVENDLVNEAKKYKSAEEFVKAQGESLYHGSKTKYDQFDFSKADKGGLYGNSAYLTPTKGRASSYGSNLTEYIVPKNAKLLKEADFESKVRSIEPTVPYGDITVARKQAVEQFIKEGFDGVKTKDTVAIFNPKALKTKSQFTDIWDKANYKRIRN